MRPWGVAVKRAITPFSVYAGDADAREGCPILLPQVARLMQVYLFRTEPALKRWGVSLCCCRSSGLGRWDSGAVRNASCEVRADVLCLFWSSLPLRLHPSGGLHSGQGETPDSTVVKLWLRCTYMWPARDSLPVKHERNTVAVARPKNEIVMGVKSR